MGKAHLKEAPWENKANKADQQELDNTGEDARSSDQQSGPQLQSEPQPQCFDPYTLACKEVA